MTKLASRIFESTDDNLRRLVRWVRKADDLRGIPLPEVPRTDLEEEALWAMDPHQDQGMYG